MKWACLKHHPGRPRSAAAQVVVAGLVLAACSSTAGGRATSSADPSGASATGAAVSSSGSVAAESVTSAAVTPASGKAARCCPGSRWLGSAGGSRRIRQFSVGRRDARRARFPDGRPVRGNVRCSGRRRSREVRQ